MSYCHGESGTCKNQVTTAYKGIPFCSKHWFEAKKADDAYHSSSSTNNIVNCDYCRSSQDGRGNYDPANGKVYGRFNKTTKECDFALCDYHPWNCGRKGCSNTINKGKGQKTWTLEGHKKKFCSKECSEKFLSEGEKGGVSQPCDQCGKKLGDTYYYNKDKIWPEKFCSQNCYQNFYKADGIQSRLEKIKELKNSIKNWEDISKYNWESADWLDEEDRKNCREYEKNRKQREKLKQEGRDYSTQKPDERITEAIGQNFSSPISSSTGDSTPSSSSPANHSFFSPNKNSSEEPSITCKMCKKTYSDESEHNSQSPDCQRLYKIVETAVNNINQGKMNELSELNKLPEEWKNAFCAWQEIKINKKWIDIDKLNISEEMKEHLQKEQMKVSESNPYGCGNCGKNFDSGDKLNKHMRDYHGMDDLEQGDAPILPKILIGGVLFLVFIIVLGIIIKKRKRKKKFRKT